MAVGDSDAGDDIVTFLVDVRSLSEAAVGDGAKLVLFEYEEAVLLPSLMSAGNR